MTETLQLLGVALPVPVWAAIIAGIGALTAAVVGGVALLIAQLIGRKNLRLQLEKDERHFQFKLEQDKQHFRLQIEQDEKRLQLEMERDDRKRLQDARLAAYEAFFKDADLWVTLMAHEGVTPEPPMPYHEFRVRVNQMIAASQKARLVAPAATVELMRNYLGAVSHAGIYALESWRSPQGMKAKLDAEKALAKLTDAARVDVGNSDGNVGLMFARPG